MTTVLVPMEEQVKCRLHVYVDLVAGDATAAQRYPGVAAHLRACGPRSEDFRGLLAAVTGTSTWAADGPR